MLSFASYNNVLTFDEAVEQHSMLREACGKIVERAKTAVCTPEVAKLMVDYSVDSWNEMMGAGDPDSAMASAIRSVIPLDYIPLLSMRSGIPAAYMIVHLIEYMLIAEQAKEDLEDSRILRQVVTSAFAKFEERRQNADNLAEGFGCDQSVAWANLRKVEDRSGQMTPVMTKIAKLAGRMYKAFDYSAVQSASSDPHEVSGVETGGTFERMLDDEAASIGVDPEAMVRVSEDRAYQYKMQGESTKNRGPLVVAVDESGSMHEHREVWSKACAVALARVAHAEGRAVRAVHFSVVTDAHDVRPGNVDDMRLLAESHVSGGTNIGVAVEVALKQVGDLKKNNLEGADIVFITDGEGYYSKEPFERMVKDGVQLWTVAIDVDIKAVAERSRSSRGMSGVSGWLYDYATAYVHLDRKTIIGAGDSAIKAAVKLKTAALGNVQRVQDAR